MIDPVGEDAWLGLVDEASRNARDIERRIEVVELYKRAIAAEPWSNKIWLAYCEWFWSLHTDCQTADAGWSEEDRILGQELFTLDIAVDMWKQGTAATKYRISDSHELWNRWISIEIELLARNPSRDEVGRIRSINRIRDHFLDRLQVPHATWNDTSQALSTFLSKHDDAGWETTMVQSTQLSQTAKELYSHRDEFELKLKQALEYGEKETLESVMREYLDWESLQPIRKPKKGVPVSPPILGVALYERALSSTGLGLDPGIWEDYLVFLSATYSANPQANLGGANVLKTAQRAATHCPWSGALWARYLLSAEADQLEFSDVENIKHAATSAGLDRDGMAGVVEVYIAWSGYLSRRTLVTGADDEVFDTAHMGLLAALESVQEWGQRLYGKKEYTGDSLFRIERILIQFLTQKGSIDEARDWWRKLCKSHGTSYEFWQQYYLWEMTVRPQNSRPTLATAVLLQAVRTRSLDWPEKIFEIYIRHCHNYEDTKTLIDARDTVHRQSKNVAKRREQEVAEQAALYAQQQPEAVAADSAIGESPSNPKRKRETASEEVESRAPKKYKAERQDQDSETRDRENTTAVVTGLPVEASTKKIQKYFKEFGQINRIKTKIEVDGLSQTAMIEFKTHEDVLSAFLRDGKYFEEQQIRVTSGSGLTLYVTNYPPTADDEFFHQLFKDCGEIFDIRLPSLKYNVSRRFCYISFKTREAAAAATKLDGKKIEGFKLLAKYADVSNKKDREGATAEGRELHVTGIDSSLQGDDLGVVFSKYGKIQRVNLLTKSDGTSKGSAFIAFERKEDATAALELDKTKLKSTVLHIELAVSKNFKPVVATGASASPGPGEDLTMSPAPALESSTDAHALSGPPRSDSANRTITLMGVPDTVNDSRIRALAAPHGKIVKVVLRLDHQGAIIEYDEASAAGKAALSLEGYEINPGRKLRVGNLKDLFAQKDEKKSDRLQIGQGTAAGPGNKVVAPRLMPVNAPIRRPGGRGGLGVKRGLGYSGTGSIVANASSVEASPVSNTENQGPQKSNDDFRQLMNAGRQ